MLSQNVNCPRNMLGKASLYDSVINRETTWAFLGDGVVPRGPKHSHAYFQS